MTSCRPSTGLTGWPEKVRLMQRNWIGRSEGLRFSFELEDARGHKRRDKLLVYTTRHDTIFGASFCAIAAEHPLARDRSLRDPEVAAFRRECEALGTSEEAIERAEKKGVFLGLYARHPFRKGVRLPVYAANFVLLSYGEGAIFGCPAHDQRDLDFARKYGLPVVPVVAPRDAAPERFAIADEAFLDKDDSDVVLINSDFLDGLTVPEAKEAVARRMEEMGIGERKVNFRLRDWGVSRQRYWGCPIPVIHCPACGIVPVPRQDLPVTLPEDVTFDVPGNPLDRHPTWKHVACPRCGERGPARDRYVRHLRRFLLVLRPLLLARTPKNPSTAERAAILDAGRPIYRRHRARNSAPPLFALLRPRHEADRPYGRRGALRQPVHAGHGHP